MTAGVKIHGADGGQSFRCPGCDDVHQLKGWTWNGSVTAPTFSPSVLVQSRRWENGIATPKVCHSFVTDGRIQFLADSTHALAGQTVELPNWETS